MDHDTIARLATDRGLGEAWRRYPHEIRAAIANAAASHSILRMAGDTRPAESDRSR